MMVEWRRIMSNCKVDNLPSLEKSTVIKFLFYFSVLQLIVWALITRLLELLVKCILNFVPDFFSRFRLVTIQQ